MIATPNSAQVAVTMRPTGKIPSLLPGRTKGVGRADARLAAPTGDPAKTPFTKEAS